MMRTIGRALLAGVLLAASLPPWGWWPLAFAGLVLLDRLIADQPAWSRFRRGWWVAAGLLFPSMSWLFTFTAPGYVIAASYYAAIFALACMATPPTAPGRWIALPGAWVLAEAFRGRWPFGGVPVSRLAMGQVDTPLVNVARVGGPLLLDLVAVLVGVAVAAAVARHWRASGALAVAVVALVVVGVAAPRGHDIGELRIAAVQGGGPQGTRFFADDAQLVYDRHVQATTLVQPPVDVVLWPENVVNIEGRVTNSDVGAELSDIARGLHTTLLVGVVEGDGNRFHNAQVAIDPSGNYIDRYEKVHRVPFGEYVPLRWLLEPIAGNSLISRDALDGADPPVLRTPAGTFGVAISWEVFFADRARAAIRRGGEVLLNPTNGASFHGSIIQSQQIASSRLRAIETGRWVVQAAPTGFSAVITPDGRVVERTGISEQRVLEHTIERRRGLTWAVRVGDWLALLLAVALVAGGWFVRSRGGERLHVQHDRHRAVVDEGDPHLGAEPAGGHGRAELAQARHDDVDEGLGDLGTSGGDPRGPAPP
jgi:apolipoprotein N-acyltransferase